MASQTVENYLKAIFKLSEDQPSNTLVSTTDLARAVETAPASVTDMVKKLAYKKLLNYTPYQGVRLSTSGKKQAIDIIRKHRLWELFLVDTLHFTWDEVHDVAEQLEHIQSPLLTDRISEHLGHPSFDPHGDPIPDKDGNFAEREEIALSEMLPGQIGILAGVKNDSSDLLRYLNEIGLNLNTRVSIMKVIDFDKSLAVHFNGADINLSRAVCENLLMTSEK